MRVFIFFIFSVIFISVQAQVTFVVTSLPNYTPSEDQIYITGDFNSWDPGDAQYALTKNVNNLWEITLDGFSDGQTIEFKFSRGNWKTVEVDELGNATTSRTLIVSNGSTNSVSIKNWADENINGATDSIAAENVYLVSQAFYMPQLDRSRRVTIYLPPDYESSGLSYPVIYMQDGQNMFASPDWEMEIDETLNSLANQGYNVPIVVGIDNGEWHRANEYLPKYFEPLGAGGEGNEYMQFIVETLKPYIDNTYRTLPDRKKTGIIGGSFGGLISWYGAMKYQNIFSKCGVFSPAYWGNDYDIWNYLSEFGFQQDIRFYQNVGETEDINQYINYMY
ncbi:MAG: alpha/beta hydrolase-fold protein, partial [Bacteroidales bacterium]|nr:alpha/beta hydrolase-fold protein [Bacteroidales bacterium]